MLDAAQWGIRYIQIPDEPPHYCALFLFTCVYNVWAFSLQRKINGIHFESPIVGVNTSVRHSKGKQAALYRPHLLLFNKPPNEPLGHG